MALRYSFQVRLSRGKSSLSARPWRESRRVVLLALVGVNVASFVAQFFLDTFEPGFVRDYLALSNRGVHVAYAMILPELDLIAWRLSRFSFHVKAKQVACAILLLSLVMLVIDRNGAVVHSAIPGGLAAGWLYANLLGFGHVSWLRRLSRRRREAAERVQRMTPAEFIEHAIDPLLEKISRDGMQSLSRAERRLLFQAHEKIGQI